MEGKRVVGIMPALHPAPSGRGGQFLGHGGAVFEAVFGHQSLAGLEVPALVSDLHVLIATAHQGHFHPALIGLPSGAVAELRWIAIGVQFALEPVQEIAGEGGGDPCGIVVGGFQDRGWFGMV